MENINNDKNPVILFDSNFFLLPEQFKIDIFEKSKELLSNNEPIFCIFDETKSELNNLTKNNSKHSLAAKIGLQLIKKLEKENNIKVIDSFNDTTYVDKLLINYKNYIKLENSNNFYIATQDKDLKLKLKEKNVRLIVLAQKNILRIL